MKSLAITDDWDIALNDNGDFFLIEDNEELLQAVSHAVYTFAGEDPFNENNGIPYFEEILSNKISAKNLIEPYMRHECRDIEGIINVYLVDENFSNISRDFRSTISITTTGGNNQ